MKRTLVVLMTLLLLAACCAPFADAAAPNRKAKRSISKAIYHGGDQIVLSGKLKITRLKGADHLAELLLDEPADFIGVLGDDGFVQDHFQQTTLLAQVPNKHSGKKVRVTGTLGARIDPVTGLRRCALLNASVSVIPSVKSVSLSKKSASVRLGETVQLLATVAPATADQRISWSVNRSFVIRVNQDGLVTPLMKGSAIVTARGANGKKAVCKVKVLSPVTGITLKSASLRMKKGGVSTIKASVQPSGASNKKVIWASSDTTVATVNSKGRVSARAKGVAIVTATTADGGFSAECDILVDQNPVPVTGITLDPHELALQPGESMRLSAVIAPTNATDKSVRWLSSDVSIASVSGSGLVTAQAEGSCEITVKAVDGELTAVCRLSVAILPEPPVIVKLKSVDVGPRQFQLIPGATQQLTAAPSPAEAELPPITWSSLDPAMASVDQTGLVTAKKKGLVILVADSGLTDDDGEPIIGTAVCVINGSALAPFAPTANDLQITRSNKRISLPISFSDVGTLMPGGDPEEALNEDTGLTELRLIYDEDDSVLVFVREGGYVFERVELGDTTVKTARGLITYNTVTKMLATYGMPDEIVALPDDECISCSYFVDSNGTKYQINFMIDYLSDPQVTIGCSIGVAR